MTPGTWVRKLAMVVDSSSGCPPWPEETETLQCRSFINVVQQDMALQGIASHRHIRVQNGQQVRTAAGCSEISAAARHTLKTSYGLPHIEHFQRLADGEVFEVHLCVAWSLRSNAEAGRLAVLGRLRCLLLTFLAASFHSLHSIGAAAAISCCMHFWLHPATSYQIFLESPSRMSWLFSAGQLGCHCSTSVVVGNDLAFHQLKTKAARTEQHAVHQLHFHTWESICFPNRMLTARGSCWFAVVQQQGDLGRLPFGLDDGVGWIYPRSCRSHPGFRLPGKQSEAVWNSISRMNSLQACEQRRLSRQSMRAALPRAI